jgi:hypothetical protein
LKKIEQRSKKRKRNFSQSRSGWKKQLIEHSCSITGLEKKREEPFECQVMKLVKVIQQLQQRVVELELQTIPSTPQEVRNQRELNAQSAVERIKTLATECK